MTKDDIIRMAREAGIGWLERAEGISEFLERFANLVAAATLKNSVMTDEEYEQAMADEGQRTRLTFDAEVIEMVKEAVEMEREACAKVCEAEGERVDASWVSCAFAIRKKGQQ